MATESLIVELDARTQKLDAALKSTNKKLDELTETTGKTDLSFAKFTSTAATLATGVIAAGTALASFITIAAKSNQEMQNLSRVAGQSQEDFEAMAFAFAQAGIDAKGTADALNDVTERLGEFAAAGSGPFQDFADVMGLSAEEAQSLAEELQYLSGDQALQRMVDEMEEANVSSAQMSFVMKSLSSELEYASDLFVDNGAKLEDLTSKYDEANKALSLTQEEAKGLEDAATSFDLLTDTLGNGAKVISASLAPALSEFFNGVIEVVPRATQVVLDFINSFKEAENIENLDSLNRLIADQEEEVNKLIEAEKNLIGVATTLFTAEQNLLTQKQRQAGLIQEETQRLDELKAKREEVTEQQERQLAIEQEQEEIRARLRESASTAQQVDADISEWERYVNSRIAIENALQLELQGLGAGYVENEIENLDYLTQAYDEYAQARIASEKLSTDGVVQNERSKEKALSLGLNAAQDINSALLDDNKAVGAGIIVVDTAIGVQKALAQGGMFGWAQAAAIAASGVAQLSNLESATRGGGTTVTPSEPADIETAQASDTLTATGGDISSGNNIVIQIESDDTATAEYINGILSTAKVSGAIS